MYEEHYQETFTGEKVEDAFNNLLDYAKNIQKNPPMDGWAFLDTPHPPIPDQLTSGSFEIVSQNPVHPDVARRFAGELERNNDERLEKTYLAIAVADESCFQVERTEQLEIFVKEDAGMWGDTLLFEFEKAGKIKPGEIIARSRTLKRERHQVANPKINSHEGLVKYMIQEDDLPLGMGMVRDVYDSVQEAVDACVSYVQTPKGSYRGGKRSYTVVGVVKQDAHEQSLATIETETLGYECIFQVDVLVQIKPSKPVGWMFIGPKYEWDGATVQPDSADMLAE